MDDAHLPDNVSPVTYLLGRQDGGFLGSRWEDFLIITHQNKASQPAQTGNQQTLSNTPIVSRPWLHTATSEAFRCILYAYTF